MKTDFLAFYMQMEGPLKLATAEVRASQLQRKLSDDEINVRVPIQSAIYKADMRVQPK